MALESDTREAFMWVLMPPVHSPLADTRQPDTRKECPYISCRTNLWLGLRDTEVIYEIFFCGAKTPSK